MATGRQSIKAELPRGHRIGRYRIEDPVGQGGMGTVYQAFDETTNRNVALKVLAPDISEALRERFLAECEAQAKIRHPHIMPVYDQGWLTDTRPYFTMELVYDPVTLAEIVEWAGDGSLSKRYPRIRHWADPVKLIGEVLLPISEGMAVANVQYRIQHRDLKPDNILVDTRTRRPYVIDFGICRDIDGVHAENKIVGTPRFLSTEQARGQVSDTTDVWGLGANLYYAIAGQPPLEGSSQFTRPQVNERILQLNRAEQKARAEDRNEEARGFAARRKQLEAPDFRTLEDLYGDARSGKYLPLPASTSGSLRAIIDRSMAAESSDRYADAAAFVEDLRRWVEGGTVQALAETDPRAAAIDSAKRALQRNRVRVVGAVAALILGVVLGSAMFKRAPLRPDFRAQDVTAGAEALIRRAENHATLARTGGLDPRTARTAHDELHHELGVLEASWAVADQSAASPPDFAALRARIAPRALRIMDSESWLIVDLLGDTKKGEPYVAGKTVLPPGLYQLRRRGEPAAQITVHVPFAVHADGAPPAPIEVQVPAIPKDGPVGMLWVPPTKDATDESGLLVARALVTCEQYGEYLDDIPSSERPARVPPKGFHQGDPNDSTRWLAKTEFQDKPVTGLSPEAIEAYLTWRGQVDGVSYRLLTDDEWQHVAGRELVGSPGAECVFPDLRSPRLETRPSSSPYGVHVRRSHKQWGEVVAGAGGALQVKGDDETLPLIARPASLARSVPYEPGAEADYGFRLALELE